MREGSSIASLYTGAQSRRSLFFNLLLALVLPWISRLIVRPISNTRSIKSTHLPRRDGNTSQLTPEEAQLEQGWHSVTLHLTRRELHSRHACFARARLAVPVAVEASSVAADGNMLHRSVSWLGSATVTLAIRLIWQSSRGRMSCYMNVNW